MYWKTECLKNTPDDPGCNAPTCGSLTPSEANAESSSSASSSSSARTKTGTSTRTGGQTSATTAASGSTTVALGGQTSSIGQPSPDRWTSSRSVSAGAIAGIVVGVVAAFVVIAAIVFLYLRRKKRSKIAAGAGTETAGTETAGRFEKAELDSTPATYPPQRSELPEAAPRYELDGNGMMPEMAGDGGAHEVGAGKGRG